MFHKGAPASGLPQALSEAFDAQDFGRFEQAFSTLSADQLSLAYDTFGEDAAAAGQAMLPILELLLPHRRHTNDFLLAAVVDSKSPAVADAVIAAGVNIKIPPSFEDPLLIKCAKAGEADLIAHLLSPDVRARTGLDPGHEDSYSGWQALAEADSPEAVQALIKGGATVRGSGALHNAAHMGRMDLVSCFLQYGADVNEDLTAVAQEERGRGKWWVQHDGRNLGTPLNFAVDLRRESVVRLLLENGADPDMKSLEWRTVREQAQGSQHPTHPCQSRSPWPELHDILKTYGH